MPRLHTARLTITPFTLDLMRAALRERREVERLLGARVPPGWPNPDEAEALPLFVRELERDPASAEWGQHLFIHTTDRAIAGGAGWKGRPDPTGTVEIGYGVVPSYQRQGYATEGVRALVVWAFAHPEVRRVIADCRQDNPASIRVLEKLGMRRLAPTGDLLNWELPRATWAAAR